MIDIFSKFKPMKALRTSIPHHTPVIKKIRAVVFDIYGTLLMSDSGDLYSKHIRGKIVKRALALSGIQIPGNKAETVIKKILPSYLELIEEEHRFNWSIGIGFPEVDIRGIWRKIFVTLGISNYNGMVKEIDMLRFATAFECCSNPVWPMEGLKEILQFLGERKLLLGIISNAQFYTPILMNYFLSGKYTTSEKIDGFIDEAVIFSYNFLRAKPDPVLFNYCISALHKKKSIKPENILYVGNDMLSDISAARSAGMRTCLFAGDKRSLRLRDIKPDDSMYKPDAVITKLEQIKNLIG